MVKGDWVLFDVKGRFFSVSNFPWYLLLNFSNYIVCTIEKGENWMLGRV